MTKYKKLPKYNVDSIHFVTTKTFENKPFFLNWKCCDILLENMDFYRKKLLYKIFGYVVMPDHLHVLVWYDVSERMGDELAKQKQDKPVSTHIHITNGVGSGLSRTESNAITEGVGSGLSRTESNAITEGVGSGLSRTESQIDSNVNITAKNAPLSISKIMHRIKGKAATDIRTKLNIDYKWQKKFYDFNIISMEKLIEKMNYIHKNPYKDKRIENPDKYPFSSRLYLETGKGIFRVDRITDIM